MIRKFVSLSAAVLLSLLVLPVLPASAVTGAATLLSGGTVYPGVGQDFSVRVNSSESTLINGATINNVEIILPNGAGFRVNAATVAPSGWTLATVNQSGGAQTYQFRAPANGGIAPGANLTFPFKANVLAPSTSDKAGVIDVLISSDRGATQQSAASLPIAVKVLEVVDGGLKALTPNGVAVDQSGTAQQTVTYAETVKNYATTALTVKPELTSNNANDQITNAASALVPAGGTTTFTHTIKLDGGNTSAATANRTATLTGKASSTNGNGSAALDKTATLGVEAPALISLTANTFTPANVKPGLSQTFSIGGTKQRTPGLVGLTGTLKFLTNTATLNAPTALPNNNAVTFTYNGINVVGPDGRTNVVFHFQGTDSNDFPFSQDIDLANLVNLDSVAPVLTATVTLPNHTGGSRSPQGAVKNGDTVTISGTVDACAAAALDYVRIHPNVGADIPVNATQSSDKCTFTASVKPTFDAAATSFVVVAQATDNASNTGGIQTPQTLVDNVLPVVKNGQTLDPSAFPGANPVTGPVTKIQAYIVETSGTGKLFGGCTASQWTLPDNSDIVTAVLYSDGTPCKSGDPGPAGTDNSRILVLSQKHNEDYETQVTYTPGRRPGIDPLEDDAAGDALQATIDIVTGVVPLAPVLSKVQRNTGGAPATWEQSTFDEGQYFTRFGGSDAVVTFAGAKSGYAVRVRDGNGAVISTTPKSTSPADVVVPIGTTNGTSYTRTLSLINGRGLEGPRVSFVITLDQTLPTIGSSALNTARDTVDVTFSEKLAAGSDFSSNWKAYASNPNWEPGDDPSSKSLTYGVSSVSGTAAQRSLKLAKVIPAGNAFLGVDYLSIAEGSVRYIDRAGNQLNDTSGV